MNPEDFVLNVWKQQLDAGFRMIETLLEGATKLHEAQLEAACGAHADLVATQKKLETATSVSELLRLQAQWAGASLQNTLAYWRQIYEAMSDANAEVVDCMRRKAA